MEQRDRNSQKRTWQDQTQQRVWNNQQSDEWRRREQQSWRQRESQVRLRESERNSLWWQQRQQSLQQQQRLNQWRFQQSYWNRLRQDQIRLQSFNYYDYGSPTYYYSRGGQYYDVNQYGADLLTRAVNAGYEEGFRAGQADRQDGWQFDAENTDAFTDASYGYDGYYVDVAEYQYYFREGFRRGYEDGYYGRYQYGSYSGGKYQILGNILSLILDLTRY